MCDNNYDFTEIQNDDSESLKKFIEGIPSYFTVNEKLHDNSLNGGQYSSKTVLDSDGRAIDCLAVFGR